MTNLLQKIELITHGEDVRVTTLEIAKHILSGSKQKTVGRVNSDLTSIVKKYIDGFEELGKLRFETADNPQGEPTEYIELNEPQTNLLFMSMRNSNPIVWRFKVELAKQFTMMRKFIIQRHNAEWIKHRDSGKIVTKRLTEIFNDALTYSHKNHDSYQFANLQQAIYKSALGKTYQQLRKERNIPKNAIIRDYLTPKELERISMLQSLAELSLQHYKQVDSDVVLIAITRAGSLLFNVANQPLMIEVA